MLKAEDRIDLLDLYARYSALVDARDHRWVELFTVDAIFEGARTFRGHEELHGFIDGLVARDLESPHDHTQHWNGAITLTGTGGEVHGACHLLRVGRVRETGELRILTIGRYRDRIVSTTSGWRFAHRVTEVAS